MIKFEKLKTTVNEKLIRQFNLKMFDKVVSDLRNQSQHLFEENIDIVQIEAKLLGEFLYETNGID